MHVRLFNVRSRQASQQNTVASPPPRKDPWDIISSLDPEFDSFGHAEGAHDVEAVAPGLVAHDGAEGPVVERRAA